MTEKPIQLFVPTFDVEGCLTEIRECLEVGWTGMGFKTERFEAAWSEYTELPHSHFLSSATAGVHLALKYFKDANKWEDGDEVISTALTFVSTNHPILYERLNPVFADVDASLCLDPKSIEQSITSKTRAVIYVGIGGNTGQLDDVIGLCRERRIKLILDAAHMAGTHYHGKHVGAEIDCTVFSFQAVKNLPTADSGMICFAEAEADREIRKYSWLGINKDTFSRAATADKKTGGNYKWMYDVEYVGFKAHGNSIIASIGLTQLKRLEQDNARRREVCALYDTALGECPEIRRIPVAEGCESSRHLYQTRVPAMHRDGLIVYLNAKGIFPGVHYRDNLDYRMYSSAKGTCPNATQASLELVSLPLHLRLTDEDVSRVCGEILRYFDGVRQPR
jgi:dTDP-4-amino-4,6-dideoxygalactose transaminase